MNFLGARTSLCFIQFLSKLCALQTFLLLTSILIRALLEPIQQLLRIQLSQASACSLNNSKESYPPPSDVGNDLNLTLYQGI